MEEKTARTLSPKTLRLSLFAANLRSRVVFVALDSAVVVVAYTLAEVLSMVEHAPAHYLERFVIFLAVALAVQLTANRLFGLYGRIWRHAGIEEARNIAVACMTSLLVLVSLYLVAYTTHVKAGVPIRVLPLGCLLTMLGMGVLRFHSRLLGWQRANRGMGLRIGVVGSRDAGAAVVRDMLRNPGAGLYPVAVFDDDRRTHGLSLMGVPVVGSVDDIPAAVEKFQIQQVLLAVPNAPKELVEHCLRAAEDAEIVMKIVPGLSDLVGSVSQPMVAVRGAREPRIEDLLRRPEVVTDLAAVRSVLEGRRVLVTGAGGSIGSEICRQVSEFEPEVLVMLDHDETHLHEAAAAVQGCKAEQVLADITRRDAVAETFYRWHPQVVFHAAAHKHVPILETHVVEAVRTNVFGTQHVLDAAIEFNTERLVLVSTDKAVHPTSVMGATKRLGEQMLLHSRPDDATFCAVRFGNVLGSRGSVIPTFRRQIEAGGPVTVTDPHMTRYFMSVEEAVQLVLQASVLAGTGDIFMLEMGEPLSILDLAHRMIRLSGRHPGTDIEIRITGPRIGEKLHEQLHGLDEELSTTQHPSILRLARQAQEGSEPLSSGLAELRVAAADRNEVRVRRILFDLISEGGTEGDIDEDAKGQFEPFVVEQDMPA